jgi:hypothetical protein
MHLLFDAYSNSVRRRGIRANGRHVLRSRTSTRCAGTGSVQLCARGGRPLTLAPATRASAVERQLVAVSSAVMKT